MDAAMDELIDKVKVIAQGAQGDLLRKIVDLLYDKEEEYFSPEDMAAVAEGKAQIARGETVPWEDLKKELDL